MKYPKPALSFLVFLLAVFSFMLSTDNVEAAPPTGAWAICVSQGWESDCGYYDLYGSGGEVVNRVVGGPDLADGLWNCAALGVNGCRAVKTGTVTPEYVTTTTAATTTTMATTTSTTATTTTSSTTTVSGGSSSSSTTTVAGGSSSSSTTTIASSTGSLAECPTAVCGYAVVDDQNYVYGVIVCSNACTGQRMTQSYMGCPAGCRLILQTQQTSDGNVAGWHGQDVKYNEGSKTFSLPSGGTIKSGDKLEEAVFPTTTTTSTTVSSNPVITVPANEKATAVESIAAPSGVVYNNVEKYVSAESEVVMTEKSVQVILPVVPVKEVNYEVSFDPVGSGRKVVIETGKIIDNLVTKDKSKTGIGKLSIYSLASAQDRKILIDRKTLSGKNGIVSITLTSGKVVYAKTNVKITSFKKYSSCKDLIKDFPGGIVSASKWTDKTSANQQFGYAAKPILNVRAFFLNRSLDKDKDNIICEKNN